MTHPHKDHAPKTPQKHGEIPAFVKVHQRPRASQGDDNATFNRADAIPGSKLPKGTNFYINAFSGEANGVELRSTTGNAWTSLSLNNGQLSYGTGTVKPYTVANSKVNIATFDDKAPKKTDEHHYTAAPIEHDKTYGFVTKTAADLVGEAMDAAVVRAFKDRKFSQQEALQFERAREQVVHAISDGDLTAVEAQNILKTLNAIAPAARGKK